MAVCVATSCGVPLCMKPPTPQYRSSVFSRTTTKSMSAGPLSASGVSTPGNSFTGRRLMYWSRPKRRSSSSLRSRMPGCDVGMADGAEQMASNLRSWSSAVGGQRFARFEIALAAPIEMRELELEVLQLGDGLQNLDAFGGDFRAGAVAADDGDFACVGHDDSCLSIVKSI